MSQVMSADTASKVGAMMDQVVKEGTGTAAALEGIDVAGKTGTAEVGHGCPNQLWFIAFAPAQDPRVAIAVTVECGTGFGGTVAAPIAKAVMQELLK
jgi:peptidoglycan glycosyltransferase